MQVAWRWSWRRHCCLALLRGRGVAENAAAYDLKVYRDQLAEIDRDLARGVIAETEAARLRTEISRKVLEADRAAHEAAPRPCRPCGAGQWVAIGLIAVMIVGAFWEYNRVGAPGYADMPLKSRIAMADDLRPTARPRPRRKPATPRDPA